MMNSLMSTCVKLLFRLTSRMFFHWWHFEKTIFFQWYFRHIISLWYFAGSIIFSWILLTCRCRRVECACAQTLLGILITMLWSRGATEQLELSSLLFQGATHYMTIPKIRLLQGVRKATEEEVLFLTPCTPLCFCKPTGNTLFWDEFKKR